MLYNRRNALSYWGSFLRTNFPPESVSWFYSGCQKELWNDWKQADRNVIYHSILQFQQLRMAFQFLYFIQPLFCHWNGQKHEVSRSRNAWISVLAHQSPSLWLSMCFLRLYKCQVAVFYMYSTNQCTPMMLILVDKPKTKLLCNHSRFPRWPSDMQTISSNVQETEQVLCGVNIASFYVKKKLWKARPHHLLFHNSQWVMRTGWWCGLWYDACSVLAYLVEEVAG